MTRWPKPGKSALPQEAKCTYLGEAIKISKKLPGPTSYNVTECLDKMILPRTLGHYKSNLSKTSLIDLESQAKKEIPGPLNKYNVNHTLVEPKVPIKVNFNKSMGRDNKTHNQTAPSAPTVQRIQKDKTAGPGTYDVEKGLQKVSTLQKIKNVTCISGLSMLEGQKPNMLHAEKLKVKSERSFETMVKMVKKRAPGVGCYTGVESAFDR